VTNEEILTAAKDAWPKALKAALDPAARETRKDAPEGNQSVHPSDPPHNFRTHHRNAKPGPLPAYLDAVPAGAVREKWNARFLLDQLRDGALETAVLHHSRHYVVEARRRQAFALVPGPAKIEGAFLDLEVVVALKAAEAS
jgi:hypothetical protein